MLKKKYLALMFIFIFFMITTVYGDSNEENTLRFHFFKNSVDNDGIAGNSYFLFSYGEFGAAKKGNIYSFFSNIEINDNIDGDVYLIFSNLKVQKNGGANVVKTFSSSVTYENSINLEINSYTKDIEPLIKEGSFNNYKTFQDKIPMFILKILFIIIKLFVCIAVFEIEKEFFIQGSVVFKHEKEQILKNGLMIYFVMLLTAFVFVLSVVGIPVSLVGLLLLCLTSLLGEISFSIYVGRKITDKIKSLNVKSTYGRLIAGMLVLDSVLFIPGVYQVLLMSVYPILFSGITLTAVYNLFINKRFYNTDFESALDYENPNFDYTKFRNIILKDDDANDNRQKK